MNDIKHIIIGGSQPQEKDAVWFDTSGNSVVVKIIKDWQVFKQHDTQIGAAKSYAKPESGIPYDDLSQNLKEAIQKINKIDLSQYIKKSGNASNGYILEFDSAGNIVSSEKRVDDFATKQQGQLAQTALQPGDIPSWAMNNEKPRYNYSEIQNKPTINGHELSENSTAGQLGLATSEQGAKADSAIQTITVGQTTTSNPGTNASVSISGTPQNPQINFTIPRGANGQSAINPFKGWFGSLEELKSQHTATEGDSAYVKDADPATTWSVYVYSSSASSNKYWADSGTDADTSDVQTFKSGQEVYNVGILNSLADAQGNDIISAEYGNGIVKSLLQVSKIGKFITRTSTNGGAIRSDGSVSAQANCYVNVYSITDEIRNAYMLYIYGFRRVSNTNGYVYAFYDENDVFISGWHGTGDEEVNRYMLPTEIPANAVTLRISRYQYSTTYHYGGLYIYNVKQTDYNVRDITPPLERGRLSSTGFPQESSSAGGGTTTFYINNKRTMNFVKIPLGSSIQFRCSISCYVRVYNYDNDYNLIDYKQFSYSNVDTDYNYSPSAGTQYIKIMWSISSQTDSQTNVPDFRYSLKAAFSEDWNVKNIYPSGSLGYQHICPVVYLLDPKSCNQETNEVQDNPIRAYDDGILALPSSYTNDGTPTRLIIYCHGAGVNYSSSTTSFRSTDCRPAYWRAMGYAVMDVDGECGSSASVQHNCSPESLQCYIEAYKLVVERYNIAKDGVFLGGRSMGGAMSMYIMQTSEIPVIANCPVVPVMNTLWWWNYCSSERREYLATKMGMQGTQPSWTSGRLTQSEWQYLQDNFDTLRKYSPLWSCIADLPVDKSVLFNEAFRVSGSTINVPEEVALFGTLHAKVKAPVKFFDNYNDPTVPYERNAMLMHQMLINGGTISECRMFDVSQDTDTSVTAHHFEMRADRLVTVTTPSGQVVENVPVVYIEMLRFWQRYEQHN